MSLSFCFSLFSLCPIKSLAAVAKCLQPAAPSSIKARGGFDDAHKPQEHAVWRTAVPVFVQGKHKNTSRCRNGAGAFIVNLHHAQPAA